MFDSPKFDKAREKYPLLFQLPFFIITMSVCFVFFLMSIILLATENCMKYSPGSFDVSAGYGEYNTTITTEMDDIEYCIPRDESVPLLMFFGSLFAVGYYFYIMFSFQIEESLAASREKRLQQKQLQEQQKQQQQMLQASMQSSTQQTIEMPNQQGQPIVAQQQMQPQPMMQQPMMQPQPMQPQQQVMMQQPPMMVQQPQQLPPQQIPVAQSVENKQN